MAGMTCVITEETFGTVKQIKAVILTDDAAGTASGTTTKTYSGQVLELAVIPNTGGTAPTNLFDLTITDSNGLDVLCGAGMNIAIATLTTYVVTGMGVVSNDPLTINIAVAGNAKGITLYLFIG